MEKPLTPQETIKKDEPKKEDKKQEGKKFCPYCGHALE
jgi:hypothetical protein